MKVRYLHRFNLSLKEAEAIQNQLRRKLIFSPPSSLKRGFRVVAGADVSFSRLPGKSNGEVRVYARAGVVVIDARTLETIEEAKSEMECVFPYVPGYLSFREGPALLQAFRQLKSKPEVIIFDGQGIAHPRGLGLASHLGLFLNLPSIGCAKSCLVGEYSMPGWRRGSSSPLIFQGQVVGQVVRTQDNIKPLFISVGHMINLDMAVRIVLQLSPRFRLPEPTRRAHQLVSARR